MKGRMTIGDAMAVISRVLAGEGRALPPAEWVELAALLQELGSTPAADQEAERAREAYLGGWLTDRSIPLAALLARPPARRH